MRSAAGVIRPIFACPLDVVVTQEKQIMSTKTRWIIDFMVTR